MPRGIGEFVRRVASTAAHPWRDVRLEFLFWKVAGQRSLELAAPVHLKIGGIDLIVVSRRKQCGDPEFFRMFGLKMEDGECSCISDNGADPGNKEAQF